MSTSPDNICTVKFLNFWLPTNFTVNTLNFKQKFYHTVIPPNDANRIGNDEDPDQTVPIGAN